MVVNSRKKAGLFYTMNLVVLTIIGLATLYPFVYMLFVSVSPISEVIKNSVMLYPKKITFEAYYQVLNNAGLGRAYANTIFLAVVGTCINLAMSCLGAYVLANKGVPGRKFLMSMVIMTMMFNGGLIPLYLVVKASGLIGSLWALIIPGAVSTLWMIVMRNFFQSIPASLGESARIDGCSEYRILLQVILPLSLPVMATLALFYGVAHWNQYFQAIIYLDKRSMMPLQVIIRSMYESTGEILYQDSLPPPVETVRASTIMIATLPVLSVYPFLQKYFVKGIMVGAIKG